MHTHFRHQVPNFLGMGPPVTIALGSQGEAAADFVSPRLCTAEVRGSTPLRSTTDLQGNRVLRALRETSRKVYCNPSATQMHAFRWDWLALTGTGRPPVECVSIAFCGFSPNCRKLLGEADVPGAYALRLRAL